MSQAKNNTATNKKGASRDNASDKQDLTGVGLADLIAAVFAHPDLPGGLERDLHEAILNNTNVDIQSAEYLRIALARE